MADKDEVSYTPQSSEDEYIVVCKDCRTILNPERVMRSSWYQSGQLPPCFACSGVTMEIPSSAYKKFLEDSRNGKRFL